MLAAWNVSPLTTKIVIVFGVLVLWVLIIEMRDWRRCKPYSDDAFTGSNNPDWTDEEWDEEESL